MKTRTQFATAALIATAVAALSVTSNAQNQQAADGETGVEAAIVVPQAALLTERGRQLAEELRMLKRSRESLGSKHPTLPIINQKIEDITEQLRAWEPAMGPPASNPFHPEDGTPSMNEYDLRQIVIRLTKRVAALEQRVKQLENQ